MKKKGLLPIDLISFGFILFKLLYLFFGRHRVEEAWLHLTILTLIVIAIVVVITIHNRRSGWLIDFLRNWYPLILFTYFFELSTKVNLVIFPEYLDPFFMRIDRFIFGYQPVLVWREALNHILISELFYFAYFSYYIVVPGMAFLTYFKKRECFERYVFILSFVFYICYITYAILPVMGGKYLLGVPAWITSYEGGPFQHIMAFIYRSSAHSGAAFPSSHVAVSVVVNLAALQYFRKLGYWLIPLTILLSISTVYCHYHYFIDTVFGLFYGVGFYFAGASLFAYLKRVMVSETLLEKVKQEIDVERGEVWET